MGVEKTIAKPLSGSEIIESIVNTVRKQLQRDCFLTSHLAYASFSFSANLRIQFQGTGTSIKETGATVHGNGGQLSDELEMEAVDVEASGEPAPPNEVRVEAGLGVPTIVQKPQGGIEEKRIKYAPNTDAKKKSASKAK